MQPSLEKLRKFFGLEREKGYDNSAIIGGLAKMLDYWEGEARVDSIQEEVIQAVVQRLRAYDGLSPESRADVLKGLWKRIGETYPEAAQRPASGQRPHAEPVSSSTTPPKSEAKVDGAQPEPAPASVETAPTQPHPAADRPKPGPPSRADVAPGGRHSQTPAALNAPLTVLQGVGPKHAATLEGLGLRSLGDMLYYFPRRYEDYSQLKPIKSLWYGEQLTVLGVNLSRIASTHSMTL